MNVNNLFNQLHGMNAAVSKSFAGKQTSKTYAKAPTAPAPAPKTAPPTTINLPSSSPAGSSNLPFYDTARTYQYSAEQILEMKKRAAGIPTNGGLNPHLIFPGEAVEDFSRDEITYPQTKPYGDGIDIDLETESVQADATDKAINDSKAAGGGGMPIINGEAIPDKNQELGKLAALAALLYFIF